MAKKLKRTKHRQLESPTKRRKWSDPQLDQIIDDIFDSPISPQKIQQSHSLTLPVLTVDPNQVDNDDLLRTQPDDSPRRKSNTRIPRRRRTTTPNRRRPKRRTM